MYGIDLLTDEEEVSLSEIEKLNYYEKVINHYKDKINDNKNYRSYILAVLKLIHKGRYKIHYLNEIVKSNKPTIYVFNHGTPNDIMNANEIIGNVPVHTLIATDCLDSIKQSLFKLVGMVEIDRTDKTKISQNQAFKELEFLIKAGSNIIIFPESTWNIERDKLLLPFKWGAVKLAQKTEANIVSIASFQDDKGDYYIKSSAPISIGKDEDPIVAAKKVEAVHASLFGDMVFSETLQQSKSRKIFLPDQVEYNLKKDMKKFLDPESEAKFILIPKQYYCHFRKKYIDYTNINDINGLYPDSNKYIKGKTLEKKLK